MKTTRVGLRRLRNSCDICTLSKLKCSREKPVCQRCVDRGCERDCSYSVARRPGRRRQTSVSLDHSGSYGPDATPSGIIGQDTAPITRSSALTDMVLSAEKRHDSTRGTPQYRRARDQSDEMMARRPPGIDSMDPSTHAPLDISHSGSAADLESIENFALWEWDEPGIDMDAPYCHPASATLIWDLSSRQEILGATSGVNEFTGEPKQYPSPRPSDVNQRAQLQNDQPFFTSSTDLSKGPGSSVLSVSDILSDISKNMDCKCSSQLGQLMGWVSLRPTALLPLDVVFALEQLLNQTKTTISACKNCSLGSPYMSMMFCTSMSWVIEHLETYVRGRTGVSAHSGQFTYLTVGGLRLTKEMSHTCLEALVKLRLRRVVQTARELVACNSEMKSTLLDGVRSAAAETGAAAQQMFGMLEMKGAF